MLRRATLAALLLLCAATRSSAQEQRRPRTVRTLTVGAGTLGLRRIERGPGISDDRDNDRLAAWILGGFLRMESWRWKRGVVGLRVGGSVGLSRARLRAARIDMDWLEIEAIHREPRGSIGPVWSGSASLGALIGRPDRVTAGPAARIDWVRFGRGHEPVRVVDGSSGRTHEVPVRSVAFGIEFLLAARLGRRAHAPYLSFGGHVSPVVMSFRRYAGVGIGVRLGLAVPLSIGDD